jgi:pyruvate/2-oxoglutarate dehydrogenase complex dihydrolipoamide dehydrogenase (E3) component
LTIASKQFDVVVIGGGTAGIAAARAARAVGARARGARRP